MTLYGRDYSITVAPSGSPTGIKITGLRCVFSVKKNLKSHPNTVDLKIYNLNETNRRSIQAMPSATIQIDAGYVDGQTSTIFLGDVRTHNTVREGANLVTDMGAGDGEKVIQHARAVQSFHKGSTIQQVLTALVTSLGVDPGNLSQAVTKLSPYGSLFTMGTVVSGSSARELTRVLSSVGYDWSIQNGKLQILSVKDILAGTALLLTPSTGLLDSPTVDKDGYLNAKCLMIPDVFPGRLCVLTSESLEGKYRIEETTHAGDTHGKDWNINIKAKPY